VDAVTVEENNPVSATIRINCRLAGIMTVQRLTLPKALKRLEIENTVQWKTPRFIRLEQLLPLTQTNYSLHYGIPYGECSTENVMANAGPRASDEIKPDSWRNSRIVHDWIHASFSPSTLDSRPSAWGLNIATDHQQVRLGQGLVRAEMLR